MRTIQEEVDRVREKRLLREKGMHVFLFKFERGGADHLHSDSSFSQPVKQHKSNWRIALISLALTQQHKNVFFLTFVLTSHRISSPYFFFFVPQ